MTNHISNPVLSSFASLNILSTNNNIIIIILYQAGSVAVDADDEEQLAADELDTSDDEETMEVDSKTAPSDVPMETDTTSGEKDVVSKEAVATGAKGPAAPKSAAISSGLPQSKEELESLISTIHQTVNNSVLPRLHKCLNAKVRCAAPHLGLFRKTSNSRVTVETCV